MNEELNPLQIVRDRFDQAASHVEGLRSGLIDFFKPPKRTISVSLPVEMDDGSVRTFSGYRVLHSRGLGPGNGGVRYRPDVTREEVADTDWRAKLDPSQLDPVRGMSYRQPALIPLGLVLIVLVARGADDLEVRARRSSLRRCEGRRHM